MLLAIELIAWHRSNALLLMFGAQPRKYSFGDNDNAVSDWMIADLGVPGWDCRLVFADNVNSKLSKPDRTVLHCDSS